MDSKGRNRLAREKSPYLLQHADNPVDWYPWGREAFAAARARDKPIFLSIGYSTCHWCHVMERESFENASIAALMNELFINIKVDREERPDVDHIYMRAVQAISHGGGGWPLSVFLTPDLRPFFGGTYFPPDDRYGRPGFPGVLRQVAEAYRTRRNEVDGVAGSLVEHLQAQPEPSPGLPDAALLDSAFRTLKGSFDTSWGGFGAAPKFPRSTSLSFLLRYHLRNPDPAALDMVTTTLDRMADGGMYDHLGGGFHRYSTDAQWLVPHFEKMLYDNALLARTYLEAYQLTGREKYARVVRDIFTYLLRDMKAPQGGFYAAEDADSEGEEGRFYVWSRSEADALLESESAAFCDYYDVTAEGNFEGRNILWTPRPLELIARAHGVDAAALEKQLARNRETLLLARSRRVRPHRDEKILVSWNGLLLGAFAHGHQVLGNTAYLEAARGIADFILSEMWDGSTLKARWAGGDVRYDAYLDDYAFLAGGLMDLYEASFESRYLAAAFDLLDAAEAGFATQTGGYYFAPRSNTELPARPQEVYDGALPSGNSVMALNLLRRSGYAGDPALRERALDLFRAYRSEYESYPAGHPQMLCAVDYYLEGSHEIVVAGAGRSARELIAAVRSVFLPNKVVLFAGDVDAKLDAIAPIVRGKTAPGGDALAYVCRDFVCRRPTSDAQEVLAMLRRGRGAGSGTAAP